MVNKLTAGLAALIVGLVLGVVLATLALSLAGIWTLPVKLSEAAYFFLFFFFGLLEFGDLYILYTLFVAFERDGYNSW